jgi:hypothetical protein
MSFGKIWAQKQNHLFSRRMLLPNSMGTEAPEPEALLDLALWITLSTCSSSSFIYKPGNAFP